MNDDEAAAVVTGPDGQVQSLGEFLRASKQACGLPVTRIVDAAGISRANFYSLEKDGQRPTLTTLVQLFGAMGLKTELPAAGDPSRAVDLLVFVGEGAYEVDLRWSSEERSRSHERYLSVASAGLSAVLGTFGPGIGWIVAQRLASGTGGRLGGGGVMAAATPIAPFLGGALAMAARRLREGREADQIAAAAAPSQEAVLEDLKQTAASMSTEELEALLAAMKAMRGTQKDGADE